MPSGRAQRVSSRSNCNLIPNSLVTFFLCCSSCLSLLATVRCHLVHLRSAAASLLRRLRRQSAQGQPKQQAATRTGQHPGRSAAQCRPRWRLQCSCASPSRHRVQVWTLSASFWPLCQRFSDDRDAGKLMIILAPSPAVRQLGSSLYNCSHSRDWISSHVHKNIFC